MKKLIILFILLLYFLQLYGQQQRVQLKGESGDGKAVKLAWFFREWDKTTTGFNVMRRTINNNKNGSWEKINSSTIEPGISIGKSLQNVEPDENEVNRLKQKLETLIAKRSTREIPTPAYLQRL